MCATVFTTHPSAGLGIDKAIAEAAGTIGGGLLGLAIAGPVGLVVGAIVGNRVLNKDITLLP